ncbi:MAG: LarC family nickel insertion protein, partial [Synergistaceae bacterium]|nr:LarC family nickel insertion protein [Synergistaceae bacterium]
MGLKLSRRRSVVLKSFRSQITRNSPIGGIFLKGVRGGNILYLDCGSGISGDMFLGALADIASKLDRSFDLRETLSAVALDDWDARVSRSRRRGIEGLKVSVISSEGHPHRHLSHIMDILDSSGISQRVRERCAEAFTALAEAEAGVHGT